MDLFAILKMLGGLALFLYGMDLMGEGLSRLSGGRMEQLLEKLTSNRLKGVLLGLTVTAVIQSSSATTVMVVGFVNSGIMKLTQAVGIIMGANIGTTVTSWLLSLSGIQSSNPLIRLLKPSSFSPVLAVIGVIFLMFCKQEKKKHIGNILIGFAILMFGMETMSGSVSPLASDPNFTKIFLMFSNPLLGMLVGLTLTAIIQSSSASVGILQALCLTGAVPFSTAIPIIMGQNIGTCVTALISSIGANRNAKRAAMIHLYFNLIGTTLFMVVFYSLNAIFHFAFLPTAASAAGVAIVHSMFNIGATIVLFPFGNLLVKLAEISIPEHSDEHSRQVQEDFSRLDQRFLDTPDLAMEQCSIVISNMTDRVQEAMKTAISMMDGFRDGKLEFDQNRFDRVTDLENDVDRYEDALGSYLVKISSRNLSAENSSLLSVYLHSIGDLERISDHAVNLSEAFQEMSEKKISFSREAVEELKVFTNAVSEVITRSFDAFRRRDREAAKEIEPLEEVIDTLENEVKQRHVDRLREGCCTIELGFILADMCTDLERVSDHCANLAVSILQIDDGGYDAHEYMDEYKHSDRSEFRRKYETEKKRYELPLNVMQMQRKTVMRV